MDIIKIIYFFNNFNLGCFYIENAGCFAKQLSCKLYSNVLLCEHNDGILV
jgi:hypothetical protein